MKHPSLLLGFLILQAHLSDVVAKPLALYRVEGSVSKNSNQVRQVAENQHRGKKEARGNTYNAEDFSKEMYDDVNTPKSRELYLREEERLMEERREMFIRNLASMSVSMSFAIVLPPSEGGSEIGATGTGESGDVYATVRMKLLGRDSDESFEEDVESSIALANMLASQGEKNARERPVDAIVTESDFSSSYEGSENGYGGVRAKLLGRDSDENFEEDDESSISLANMLASQGEKNARGHPVDAVVAESDFSSSYESSENGYGRVRAKLLALGSDEEYQLSIEEDIRKANNIASSKMGKMARGKSIKNLRRRL